MSALSRIYKDAGLGHYMSPTFRARYPGPEFSQFTGAEMMVEKYQLTRDALDCYTLRSHQRATQATREEVSRPRSCRWRCAWLAAQLRSDHRRDR